MRRLAWFMLWLAGLSAPATAHEIGATQVTALVRLDGSFQVDIVVDPDALLAKLQLATGKPAVPAASRTDRDRQLRGLTGAFGDSISVQFDETRLAGSVEYLPASAFSDLARAPSLMRISGRIPSRARTLTFADRLVSGTYALNLRVGDSAVQTFWLDGPEPSPPISLVPPPAASRRAIVRQYFALGFTHILPNGIDHILFVLGIFLLGDRWRSVLSQVSAFTVAHSITLGLTMYGIVSLPARVVEPMIALSIAYVAIENLVTSELKPWRLALVFSFGLLHGMGFAGVLRELGLPRAQFLNALVSFNVGVELGQLSVIALATMAVASWRANASTYRRLVVQPASFAIALVGLYWTVQRVFF